MTKPIVRITPMVMTPHLSSKHPQHSSLVVETW